MALIVQNTEIWNLSSNRIKPAGTRPPQIFVEKPKKKPLTQSWTKLLFSRFKTKRVATYLTSRLRNLLSTGIREKTIPPKLSAVRSKKSSCSHLGTGTLVFRFAFLYSCWYVRPRCSPDLCMPTSPLKMTHTHATWNQISLKPSIVYQGSVKANGGRTCYCTFLAESHFVPNQEPNLGLSVEHVIQDHIWLLPSSLTVGAVAMSLIWESNWSRIVG